MISACFFVACRTPGWQAKKRHGQPADSPSLAQILIAVAFIIQITAMPPSVCYLLAFGNQVPGGAFGHGIPQADGWNYPGPVRLKRGQHLAHGRKPRGPVCHKGIRRWIRRTGATRRERAPRRGEGEAGRRATTLPPDFCPERDTLPPARSSGSWVRTARARPHR